MKSGLLSMKKLVVGLVVFGIAGFAMANVKDSIGQKTVNGKRYILYKVEAKETLYSLSKKYNTSVDDIKTANDGLAAGLQKGATIMIPGTAVKKTQTEVEVIERVDIKPALVQTVHIVGENETLYSISKKNGVDVEDIKKWNNLTSNSISTGMELKIWKAPISEGTAKMSGEGTGLQVNPNKVRDAVVKTDPNAGIAKVDAGYDASVPKTSEQVNPVKKEDYTIDTSLYGEEVTETKSIDKISEIGIDQSKNLAQMKGVKVGTILMIVNPANNKATFVRVINGETAEGIQVTNSVLTALNLSSASDAKVKVSYTK